MSSFFLDETVEARDHGHAAYDYYDGHFGDARM
jgi:hypothetical protein